jgi:NAD(P)-dependent dehydrogenase (short-subunit alcohol dehydrogenase family)
MNFSRFDLTGKVAIMLGASRGIGRVIALGLATAGADMVVASRTVHELESLAGEIRTLGRRALVQKVDAVKSSDIQAMADATLTEFGHVDILVNNAGINVNKTCLEMSEEEWDLVLATNLKSYFLASKIVGRLLVEQQRGKVINMSSTFGLVGFERSSAYAASKGGRLSTHQSASHRVGAFQCQC